MVTENGTLKVKTALDAKMQKELMKPVFIFGLIVLLIGAIGVGVTLVLEIVAIFAETDGYFAYLIACAVFLGLGIALLIIYHSAVKSIAAFSTVNEYEFFGDHFTIDQTVNGENVLHNKIYNSQVTKVKETKSYLVFYIGALAYPVEKAGLGENELDTLRALFKLPVKGEAPLAGNKDGDNISE